jgi:hypothetical protein
VSSCQARLMMILTTIVEYLLRFMVQEGSYVLYQNLPNNLSYSCVQPPHTRRSTTDLLNITGRITSRWARMSGCKRPRLAR